MINTILVWGNPVDGLNFTGPFEGADEAVEYGEIHLAGVEYWTATMEEPNAESNLHEGPWVAPRLDHRVFADSGDQDGSDQN